MYQICIVSAVELQVLHATIELIRINYNVQAKRQDIVITFTDLGTAQKTLHIFSDIIPSLHCFLLPATGISH